MPAGNARKTSSLKIVFTHDLFQTPEHMANLRKMGKVTAFKETTDDIGTLAQRIKGADYVITDNPRAQVLMRGNPGLLAGKHVVVTATGHGWLTQNKGLMAAVDEHGIEASYCPHANSPAVAQWIVGELINMSNDLPKYINAEHAKLSLGRDIRGKTIVVMGMGSGGIGDQVAAVLKAFGAKVVPYARADYEKGVMPWHLAKTHKPYAFIDALKHTAQTTGLLDKRLFNAMQKGSIFITVTNNSHGPDGKPVGVVNVNDLMDGARAGGIRFSTDLGHVPLGRVAHPDYQRLLEFVKENPEANCHVIPHTSPYTLESMHSYMDEVVTNIGQSIRGTIKPPRLVTPRARNR